MWRECDPALTDSVRYRTIARTPYTASDTGDGGGVVRVVRFGSVARARQSTGHGRRLRVIMAACRACSLPAAGHSDHRAMVGCAAQLDRAALSEADAALVAGLRAAMGCGQAGRTRQASARSAWQQSLEAILWGSPPAEPPLTGVLGGQSQAAGAQAGRAVVPPPCRAVRRLSGGRRAATPGRRLPRSHRLTQRRPLRRGPPPAGRGRTRRSRS